MLGRMILKILLALILVLVASWTLGEYLRQRRR